MENTLKLSHIRAISNSTDANRISNASLNAIQTLAESVRNFDKVRKAMDKLPEDVRSIALASLMTPDSLTREARQATAIYYNGVLAQIRKNMDKYSDETFRTADVATLNEIHAFTLALQKMFPQAFPIPSGEKSA